MAKHICNWNNTRRNREREWKEEICEAIMAENFPKLMRDPKPHIQGAQKAQSRINNQNLYLTISHSNCRKPKRGDLLKVAGGKHQLTVEEQA